MLATSGLPDDKATLLRKLGATALGVPLEQLTAPPAGPPGPPSPAPNPTGTALDPGARSGGGPAFLGGPAGAGGGTTLTGPPNPASPTLLGPPIHPGPDLLGPPIHPGKDGGGTGLPPESSGAIVGYDSHHDTSAPLTELARMPTMQLGPKARLGGAVLQQRKMALGGFATPRQPLGSSAY